jgi:alanine dehydrogenase
MVVTYEKTAEGGVFSTIDEMERRRDDFYSPDRGPYNVVVLGMGNLGIAAGKSFFSYLNKKVIENSSEENVSECIVSYIEKDSISNKDEFKKIFNNTDVLVDATKRQDFSEYIITNELIEYLKKDSIILDLTADPYDTSKSPIQVKAIEGIPTGDLNKYIFEIDEKEYDDIPAIVNTKHRRTVISCSGWPGIFPESTMEIYEDELVPFLEVLMNNGMEVSIDSGNIYERALYRSTVGYFDKE